MLLTRANFKHALVATTPNLSITYRYYYSKTILAFIFNLLYINKCRPNTKPKSRLVTSKTVSCKSSKNKRYFLSICRVCA